MPTVIECTTAEELLQALAPVSPHFRSDDPARELILFRGCASSSWRLIPSALRDAGQRTLRHQVRVETDALARFVSECDENGLPVPNDSRELRAEIIQLSQPGAMPPNRLEMGVIWPTDRWLALMALAQHSGLPTRLLDWTASPFVAAYFAALPAPEAAAAETLAVWALSPFYADIPSPSSGSPRRVGFLYERTISRCTWIWDWRGFAFVDTTRAGNANLVAQRGYLTAHVLGAGANGMWNEQCNEPALEELLDAVDPPSPPRLRKFVMPRREAPRLLMILKRYGISTASMFPGYGGIAKSVLEKPPPGPYDP